jgi:hypothetical protein
MLTILGGLAKWCCLDHALPQIIRIWPRVAVSFNAVKMAPKNGKNVLIMNTTKDDLKTTPGYKYDRQTMTWLVDSSCKTVTCLNSSK